jgi:hypothetical protein
MNRAMYSSEELLEPPDPVRIPVRVRGWVTGPAFRKGISLFHDRMRF